MAALLVSFARDGEPKSARVPAWPAFEPERPRVVSLGVEMEIVDWPNYAALPLLAAPVDVPAPAPARTARARLS